MQHYNVVTATSGSGDYESFSLPVTFPLGSADGAEMCASVAVNSDNLVEFEENFTVKLALVTAGASLGLGSNTSTITLTDSDGMKYGFFNILPCNVILAAAMFEIPSATTVAAESDTMLSVCITMTTTPPGATVANEVVLSLSTVDGTGKTLFIITALHTFLAATVDNGDFGLLSLPLTFAPGSGDGALMCVPISILPDTKAEGEEEFTISLDLLTAGTSLSLGNNAAIVIIDDDGTTIWYGLL